MAFSGVACASTTSSKVRFMSSIIASRLPAAAGSTPVTGRGVLSSASMPIDWARRRAGSMVRTTTLRPRSAARRARAADVVVLPTPPEPQHTMMPDAAVVEEGVDVERAGGRAARVRPGRCAWLAMSGQSLLAQVARRARRARRGRRRAAVAAARTSARPAPRRARAGRSRGRGARRARDPRSTRPSTSVRLGLEPGRLEVGGDRGRVGARRAARGSGPGVGRG